MSGRGAVIGLAVLVVVGVGVLIYSLFKNKGDAANYTSSA